MYLTNEKAAVGAAAFRRTSKGQTRQIKNITTSDPCELLLLRLEGVRKSGRGWTAKCPSHQDRTASLSINTCDDGRILVHCFAGCSAADVLIAAGLQLADLFPKRDIRNMSYAERTAMREHAKQAQWKAALGVLDFEATIALITAQLTARGTSLSDEDLFRVAVAAERIGNARQVLRAR